MTLGGGLATATMKRSPAALALVVLLLSVYALQTVLGATEDAGRLVRMGALSRDLWGGEVWRLASSTLLHIGIVHIAANAYFSWAVGAQLERAVGPWRMLCIFFVGGLSGSLLSALIHPDIVSAGASGGGWALMFAQLVCTKWPRWSGVPAQPDRDIGGLIVMNGILSLFPGINGLAHLGGGVGGVAVLVVSRAGTYWRWVALGLAGAHVLALGIALWVGGLLW